MAASTRFQRFGGPAHTREEAIVRASSNWSSANSYAIWWYNRLQRAEVDLKQFDDSYVDLPTSLPMPGAGSGCSTSPVIRIPTYVAIMHWMQNGHENIEFVPARISIAA